VKIDITPLLLTFNEKENIGRTLAALSWASEIVIVDSGSTDETLKIAQATHPNVRVVQRVFDTHTAQWNFGLDQVSTSWVLSLDADYELSPALIREIAALNPDEDVAGYRASFEFRIYGHRLRSSVYPPRTVLFRRDRNRYRDEGHTQLLESRGRILSLVGQIYHDDRKPLSRWLRSQDRYLTIEARHLNSTPNYLLNRQDRLRKRIYFAPAAIFIYLLFVRGLILDGWQGWYYVCQRTVAELLLSLRLLTEREGLERETADSGSEVPRK